MQGMRTTNEQIRWARRSSAALAFAMSCIVPIASHEALAATFSDASRPNAPARTQPRSLDTRATPVVPSSPLPASRADLERYAALEHKSPSAKNYRGGIFVVVFSASALAIVLIVLLILILI